MKTELKAPSVGESITEVRISSWKKQNGEAVKAGDVLIEIESDKATVEVVADNAGVLFISTPAGETVKIGAVLGYIDSDAKPSVTSAAAAAPAPKPSSPAPSALAPSGAANVGGMDLHAAAPSVRRIAEETGVNPAAVAGTGKGGRVTKGDMLNHIENGGSRMANSVMSQTVPTANDGRERRVPMTMLRQKIAERLVFAQHTSAILTTFNECDMSKVMELRAKYKEEFKAKYGVGLGFMSFFTRAVVEALKEIPAVNAMIDGKDVIYRDYYDIGVAVGTERGLVVPVMRDVGGKSFADIEKTVAGFGEKAKAGKLSIADLTGGTFTISNGGTYGSLLSTPILNPPQSGILGMHKIQERPMAVNGQVVIRPMMYLALSYDHRMIDGKEAVTFLVRVKEGIENPVEKLGFQL